MKKKVWVVMTTEDGYLQCEGAYDESTFTEKDARQLTELEFKSAFEDHKEGDIHFEVQLVEVI